MYPPINDHYYLLHNQFVPGFFLTPLTQEYLFTIAFYNDTLSHFLLDSNTILPSTMFNTLEVACICCIRILNISWDSTERSAILPTVNVPFCFSLNSA